MEIYKRIKHDLGVLAIAFLALLAADHLAYSWFGWRADSTDGESRSGMALRVDAKTGCNYLADPSGGITPRLDRSGKQICE